MLISDWSSDLCSSDLPGRLPVLPVNRRLGKAGEYGAFEQALRIEDHVIRIGPQRISALPDFSPGGFAEQAFSPTARSYGNHRAYPGVQPRNVGKAFLNQMSERRRVGKEWVSKC